MDLEELRAFIAVADTGSFSAAAKSLKFAGAKLKRQIDGLEARSGVELLRRAADRASVTRAGEILADKGRTFLRETRLLVEAVRALEHQDDLITIDLPLGLPPQFEQSAYRALHKAAPKLRFRVRYIDAPFDSNSKSTLILHSGSRPGEHANWRHTPVARLRKGLMASDAYLKKHGIPQKVEDLASHTLHIWEHHGSDPTVLQPVLGPPVSIAPALISPSAYLIRQFVLSGEGIGYGPSSKIAAFLEPGDTPVHILRDEIQEEIQIWMSSRKDADVGALGILSGAIAKFIKGALRPLE